jgi:Sensors of blue-light using FAD
VNDLVRLVYASEATFSGNSAAQGIELEVGRILAESRRNNARAQVGGVLYYGNGYFFQCLEGERDAVVGTYQRICTDPRHRNAKILLKGFTKRRLFQDWSMKYLPAEKNLRDFLAQHGLSEFSPFSYDREMVGRLLIFFQQTKESGDLAEHSTEHPPAATSTPTKPGWRHLFTR